MYKQYFYRKIDSTQLEIWRRIEANKIDNKTVVIADIQTNGKGTHGRKWHTDEVNNIAFSFFAYSFIFRNLASLSEIFDLRENASFAILRKIAFSYAITTLEIMKALSF